LILVIDNYDSFTYNLVQYIGSLNPYIKVVKNDKLSIEEIRKLKPSHLVISPGPGNPENAGISIDIVKEFFNKIPILGVCLGHQVISIAFGGVVKRANEIVHGKRSLINHNNSIIFKNIPNPFYATRYHSLVSIEDNFPKELIITAKTNNRLIMGLEHKNYPIFGVQFHPESILTEYGMQLIKNFLEIRIKKW
tara:strand:+ start:301 stop:879 length:579 start_codon:yes stop_codon:yes gene_type:complete